MTIKKKEWVSFRPVKFELLSRYWRILVSICDVMDPDSLHVTYDSMVFSPTKQVGP
jgi:hypothetical protein